MFIVLLSDMSFLSFACYDKCFVLLGHKWYLKHVDDILKFPSILSLPKYQKGCWYNSVTKTTKNKMKYSFIFGVLSNASCFLVFLCLLWRERGLKKLNLVEGLFRENMFLGNFIYVISWISCHITLKEFL